MATGGRHAGGATIPLAVTQIATQSQFLGNSLSAQSKLVAYFCGSMVAEEGSTKGHHLPDITRYSCVDAVKYPQ